jgi:hypothetical protein
MGARSSTTAHQRQTPKASNAPDFDLGLTESLHLRRDTCGRDAQGTRPRCGAEVQGEAEQSLRHFVPGFTTIKRYDTEHRAHDAEISCDHALQRMCADKHT